MDLQHLRTFIAVAEAGSLTRAARSLFLSQPAASGQIKALEEELGLALFQRSGKGMVLTPSGEELLRHARDLLGRAEAITRVAQRLSGDVAGTLRLGVIDCGYDLKVARMVGQLRKRHPEVGVELAVGTSGDQRRAVLDQQLDAALVEGEVDDERLHDWRLGVSRLGVIGPAHWREPLEHADWNQLSEYPWIFQSPQCSYYGLLDEVSKERRLVFNAQFHAEAFGAVKDLVAEGLALSVADLDEVSHWVEAGDVFIWPGLEYAMPVRLIVQRARVEEPLIQSFAQIALAAHAKAPARRKARPLPMPSE